MRVVENMLFAVLFHWRLKNVMMKTAAHKTLHRDCANSSKHTSCGITTILTQILTGYDKGLRPFLNEHRPCTVTVGMWILSIDAINVIDMDYRIDLFFRQQWLDPRLSHSYHETLTVDNSMLENIWVPDTYFLNSKSSNFHDVTVPNKMVRISKDGTVMYNARISLRATCPMDLINFPVDTQRCQLHIESYGYDVRHIMYKWEEGKQQVFIDKEVKNLPQYNLTEYDTWSTISSYVVGNWSSLKFKFTLRRQAGHIFLHVYAPCTLIVTLSWIAFFIPRDSVAARISLGITSVLTTTTVMKIQNNSMPKVSYIKLADWYLIACFLFVFGTLVEFTIILYLSGKEKSKIVQADKDTEKFSLSTRSVFSKAQDNNTTYGTKTSVVPLLEGKKGYGNGAYEYEDKDSTKRTCFRPDDIDEYSRVLFPLSFVIFNTVYWLLFLYKT